MTKRRKNFIFFTCLVLFLLIAPSMILYSQGWRFDFERKSFTQTGALYFKVWPKSVDIYLNDEFAKRTDFFFGSTLIESLVPKNYSVKIKKEGYHSWEKTLNVQKKWVTEAKNVALVPKNPTFTILTRNLKDFWFSPDNKKIILKEIEQESWSLKIFELERNVKSHLVNEEDFSQISAEFLSLDFSSDSEEAFIEVKTEKGPEYFILEIEKTPPVLTKTEKPLFFSENSLAHKVIGDNNYYLENSGHLFQNEDKITEKPFPVEEGAEYNIKVLRGLVFLFENQDLYQFNQSLKSFEKVADSVKGITLSPDARKLAYFNDYEIWILFLRNINYQPQKKAGEKLFLTRFSEKINQVFWYNSHYLIFSVNYKIKIAEIDDRDRINIIDLNVPFFENNHSKIFFNQDDKKLYILNQENLYASEKLLP